MNRDLRYELINKIQEKRKSKLIIYITGDRTGLETKIATDSFPMINRHLSKLGQQESIDLFLYSTGGMTIAGYSLVNLLREFCNKFSVIIPFKALSCATLIALGADEILMTKMGQLSPVDPSITHPLGPTVEIPGQPKRISPVNVEDINGFINLTKKELKLEKEESRQKIIEILSSKINPIVLGAIYRVSEQIEFLGKSLMKYHTEDENKISVTIDTLIKHRFSHDYIISKREAKDILKLNIIDLDLDLENDVLELFDAYNDIIMMDKPYNPEVILGEENLKTEQFDRAMIETENLTHVFRTIKQLRRIDFTKAGEPPQMLIQERILKEEWVEDNKI